VIAKLLMSLSLYHIHSGGEPNSTLQGVSVAGQQNGVMEYSITPLLEYSSLLLPCFQFLHRLAGKGKISDFVERTFLLADARDDRLDFGIGQDAVPA
jgi:hypothetical protein